MNPAADTAAAQGSRRLSDEQLIDLMRLVKGAHSVELKLTVPAQAHRATIQGLPMDPVEAQPRQIYFFDTPDLKLFRAGVVVRARRIQGGKGDTVVKLRPVDPADISPDLKNDPSFNIEVDALPGGYVCSASFKGRSSGQDIRAAVSGKKRLSKIFSKGQRAYYAAHAPAGLDMDALVPLGPTFILKGRFDVPVGLDGASMMRSMVAEVWLYPDGTRLLELSTKCLPKEALGVAAETRAYLAGKGVPTNATQETKTRMALEFYSKALAAENADGAAAAAKAVAKTPAAKSAPAKTSPAKASSKARSKASAKDTAKAAAKTSANAAAKASAKPAVKAPAKPAVKAAATKSASTRSAATKSTATRSAAAETPARTAAMAPAWSAATAPQKSAGATTRRRATTRRPPPKG
jgi:hypothetical protein